MKNDGLLYTDPPAYIVIDKMNGINSLTERLKNSALNAGIELLGITSTKSFVIEGKEKRIVDPQKILKDRKQKGS